MEKNVVVPVTARGQETRARLLAAAEKVFGEKSFFQVSIADIVREAGVGNGTFYLYFPSKEAVFQELVRERGHQMRQVTRLASLNAADRVQAERAGYAAFFDFINQHRALYRIVRQAEFVDPKLFRDFYRQMADGYCSLLQAAMDRGEISHFDSEVLAYCLMGVGDFIGMRWVVWSDESIPLGVFEEVMRFIQFGVARQGKEDGQENAHRSGESS